MNTNNTTSTPEMHPSADAANLGIPSQFPLNRREFLTQASMLGLALLPTPRESDTQPALEQAATGDGDARYTWCFELEILSGLELFLIGYEGREAEDGDSWNRFLTDGDKRLLYCTDLKRVWDTLARGSLGAVRLADLSLEEINSASIPYALEDLREGKDASSSGELFYGIDALTDIVPSCGYLWNEDLCGFLMGCFSHMFERSSFSWEEVVSSRGYRNLSVEEGIQLAVGIILSNGCRVSKNADADLTREHEIESSSCDATRAAAATVSINSPTCYCLEVSRGLELYFLCCRSSDEAVWTPVLTDSEGRLLFCSELEAVPRLIQLCGKEFAYCGEPNLDEIEFVSIPEALNEYRTGVPMGQCWELFDVLDTMTNLLPSAGYAYYDGICDFLLGCSMNLFGSPRFPWSDVIHERGYKGLSLEEGIQLALGIVMTRGRHVV